MFTPLPKKDVFNIYTATHSMLVSTYTVYVGEKKIYVGRDYFQCPVFAWLYGVEMIYGIEK